MPHGKWNVCSYRIIILFVDSSEFSFNWIHKCIKYLRIISFITYNLSFSKTVSYLDTTSFISNGKLKNVFWISLLNWNFCIEFFYNKTFLKKLCFVFMITMRPICGEFWLKLCCYKNGIITCCATALKQLWCSL